MIEIFTSRHGQLALLHCLKIFPISSRILPEAVPSLPWGAGSIRIFRSRKIKLSHFPIPLLHWSVKIVQFCNPDLSHNPIFLYPLVIFKMNQVTVIQSQFVSCNKILISVFIILWKLRLKNPLWLVRKSSVTSALPVNAYVLPNLCLCSAKPTRPKSSLTLQTSLSTSKHKLEERGLRQMAQFYPRELHHLSQNGFDFSCFREITRCSRRLSSPIGLTIHFPASSVDLGECCCLRILQLKRINKLLHLQYIWCPLKEMSRLSEVRMHYCVIPFEVSLVRPNASEKY